MRSWRWRVAGAHIDGGPDQSQEFIDAERLVQEQNASRRQAVGGGKSPQTSVRDDRGEDSLRDGERLQQPDRATLGQIPVDHKASWAAALIGIEELPRRAERRDRMTGGTKRHCECITHRVIVIDKENGSVFRQRRFLSARL